MSHSGQAKYATNVAKQCKTTKTSNGCSQLTARLASKHAAMLGADKKTTENLWEYECLRSDHSRSDNGFCQLRSFGGDLFVGGAADDCFLGIRENGWFFCLASS
jgi:hypothetical protein